MKGDTQSVAVHDYRVLEQRYRDLLAELDQEKRWYKIVVSQRDSAWRELDVVKNLRAGTTARHAKLLQPDLFAKAPDQP